MDDRKVAAALGYPDTTIWNALCDQGVDAANLTSDLAARGTRLVLGTNAVYEMAKTFKGSRSTARERGERLFSYLGQYVQLGIPLLRATDDLLGEETKHVTKEIRQMDLFYGSADYKKLAAEVDKLAHGVFDSRAAQFIPFREAEATQTREALYAHLDRQPLLKRKLEAISEESVGYWIAQEMKRSGRPILAKHLANVISGRPLRDLTRLAKQLLALPRYRVSHAMVRSDLYLNWRYCRRGTLGKDMPDDNYHAVNASYCDMFVTADPGMASYMSHVHTRVELYDANVPLAKWLLAVFGES